MSQLFNGIVAHFRRAPPEPAFEADSCGAAGGGSEGDTERDRSKMDTILAVEESLNKVLTLLKPMLQRGQHDEAMAALALSRSEFVEPLSKHEVQVLACALYISASTNRSFSYADILDLTLRYSGREMNITMVYETIKRLARTDRQLIEFSGLAIHPEGGRQSKFYSITELGRAAFKMAILNARLLGGKPASYAA
jgi:hypothetical protein